MYQGVPKLSQQNKRDQTTKEGRYCRLRGNHIIPTVGSLDISTYVAVTISSPQMYFVFLLMRKCTYLRSPEVTDVTSQVKKIK